jgi:hypothetical protein
LETLSNQKKCNDQLQLGSTEVQSESPKGLYVNPVKEVMEGSLRLTHLEEEHFDDAEITDMVEEFVDFEIKGMDGEVVIIQFIKEEKKKNLIDER